MCYPKPGPRCSSHAAEKLLRAKIKARSEHSFENEEAEQAAQREYDATPAGMKELERRIGQSNSENMQTEYELRLQLGKAHRAAALDAIKAQDSGDISHSDDKQKTRYPKEFRTFQRKYQDNPEKEQMKWDHPVSESIIADSSNWISDLTTDEIEAVSWYTSSGSATVNCHILGVENSWGNYDETPEHIDNTIKALDSALEKTKRDSPVKVYRGVSKDILQAQGYEWDEAEKYVENNFKIGSTFESPVFMSTSLDFSKAKGFSQSGVMLEVLAKKAGSVSNVSAWGISEKEYILPRNQQYKVVGVKKFTQDLGRNYKKEYRVVQLQEI